MCGILGISSPNQALPNLQTLHHARDELKHRGPDAAGHLIDNHVYFGFRRLAIIDLSPSGNQPMATLDQRYWIVFNGEIYNYIELRQELIQAGYSFQSSSDTEVILHLYHCYGTEMLAHLNGMFALAIYDRQTKQILLARDRLGQKPFFYTIQNGRLAFASELSALRKIPSLSFPISPEALGHYIRLGWVPNWSCIYQHVHKLPPGEFLEFNIEQGTIVSKQAYWTLPDSQLENSWNEQQWLDQIQDLLWDATRIRLRADVPVGVFLSGGIDSGLIATAASQSTTQPLTSLTIGFPDWGGDEWPIAQETAAHLNIQAQHRTLHADGMTLLPQIMAHFDEPFADSSALPTALVCQEARKIVTVALSGDAGDELFAGYTNHVRGHKWRHIEQIPRPLRNAFGRSGASLTRPDSPPRRLMRRLQYPITTWGMGAKSYPFEDWVDQHIQAEFNTSHAEFDRFFTNQLTQSSTSIVDQIQRNDIRFYMLNDILVKVDRMSMYHSLEVRSPFLDHRLVELALQIPTDLRLKNGQNKYLLRQLAKRHLPATAVKAPKKGFGIPLSQWLFNSPHTPHFKETLLTSQSNTPEPFGRGGAESLWQKAQSNPALSAAVFRMLAYRWWSQKA